MNGFQFVSKALNLTANDVTSFIDFVGGETEWLEFKAATRVVGGTGDHLWNVARALIAMANSTGGLVVLGVCETGMPSAPLDWCDLEQSGFGRT